MKENSKKELYEILWGLWLGQYDSFAESANKELCAEAIKAFNPDVDLNHPKNVEDFERFFHFCQGAETALNAVKQEENPLKTLYM